MFSAIRLTQIGYVFGFSFILSLLLLPSFSQAQNGFGVSTGYRSTPGLPTIAIPVFSTSGSSSGSSSSGGLRGFGGGSGSGSASFSSTPSILTIHLGSFFPNNGQIIGLPPPPMNFPLNNFLSDSTGAPLAIIGAMGGGGGGSGVIVGGIAGGAAGVAGGAGGISAGGIAGGGGMGGFAGKGFGGFNGKKPL